MSCLPLKWACSSKKIDTFPRPPWLASNFSNNAQEALFDLVIVVSIALIFSKPSLASRRLTCGMRDLCLENLERQLLARQKEHLADPAYGKQK